MDKSHVFSETQDKVQPAGISPKTQSTSLKGPVFGYIIAVGEPETSLLPGRVSLTGTDLVLYGQEMRKMRTCNLQVHHLVAPIGNASSVLCTKVRVVSGPLLSLRLMRKDAGTNHSIKDKTLPLLAG